MLIHSYADVIAFQDGKFRKLSKDVVELSKKNFKLYDLDNDNFLDFHDVTKMMEKLGQPKTVTEIRQMIADIDDDKDG